MLAFTLQCVSGDQEKAKKAVERMDTSKDGTFSVEEFTVASKKHAEHHKKGEHKRGEHKKGEHKRPGKK